MKELSAVMLCGAELKMTDLLDEQRAKELGISGIKSKNQQNLWVIDLAIKAHMDSCKICGVKE